MCVLDQRKSQNYPPKKSFHETISISFGKEKSLRKYCHMVVTKVGRLYVVLQNDKKEPLENPPIRFIIPPLFNLYYKSLFK